MAGHGSAPLSAFAPPQDVTERFDPLLRIVNEHIQPLSPYRDPGGSVCEMLVPLVPFHPVLLHHVDEPPYSFGTLLQSANNPRVISIQ